MITRDQIITHIKMMQKHDPAYAQKSLAWYTKALPWLDLPGWGELESDQGKRP